MDWLDPAQRRAYHRAWWAKNSERIKARREKYREKNLEGCRSRYRANPEAKNAKTREWQEKNRKHVRAVNAAWRKRNRARMLELQREWRKRNLLKMAAKAAKRRALKKSLEAGTIDYQKVLRRANGLCGICQEPFDLFGVHFDHIVPISRGGAHAEDNLQATHAYCNLKKSNRCA